MRKEQGIIKWFDKSKGYGFIISDATSKELFFHHAHIDMLVGEVDKGERVEFEIFDGSHGPEAQHVRSLNL
jgi:CspA family cold shock protein